MKAEKCEGFIDRINGESSIPAKFSVSGLLRVEGWLATSVDKGTLPEAVYAILTDTQDRYKYLKAHFIHRPDVGPYFKKNRN
jgi:hypothetical protein